jgi:hypothetical protein
MLKCYDFPKMLQLRQIDALLAVRAVSRSLNEEELRVIIELASRACADPEFYCEVDQEDLALATGCSEAVVRQAITLLATKRLLVPYSGMFREELSFHLIFLREYAFTRSISGCACETFPPN